ncbi:hypothetical protein [Caulobacter sp. UNC279MFTsu5.1]|uniref:hypothetical protein n=1 Tax=Caulobacter sp. UNC279MFTsu5.1 TaxID=1502775 RepID=UPI0003727AD0|nr:hypothetical protein [Caulobacter sp. UNC279MFTsu5.1]SFK22190.1 hypothetical protein SAMN02799626_03733 [Caulobacter sp. UNC279MFTsu5.1]
MNFGAALDVAIGLIFVYLLVSLFVTALNEYISSFLNKRSEFLLQRVQSLLGGDGSEAKSGEWSPQMCAVWNHPLINALKSHNQAEDHGTKRGTLLKNAPSYIPGKTFAVALTETLKPSETTHLSFAQLKTAVAGIENNEPLKAALLPMLDDAEGKLDVFQQNVATWFDRAMDRTSGTYKRWVHRLTFWAGFGVAVAFNVNSLQLIDNLWRDPVARAGLVAQASQTAQSADDVRSARIRLSAPATAPDAPAAPEGDEAAAAPDAQAAAPECACDGGRNAADLAQDLPLPIGWSGEGLCALVHEPLSSLPPSTRPSSTCKTPYRSGWSATAKIFLTLLGLAITGLAVSLGSPFWFGILQSVTNIRATGIKPDRADGSAQK